MRILKSKWTVLIALVAAVAIFAGFSFSRTKSPQYFSEAAQRGDIHDVVESTGTINAVTTVQVGSQVSGTISALFADFNSHVKKGQIIAQIEPSLFKGAVLQAQADMADAQANAAAAKANLEKAKAAAQQSRADYNRTAPLANEGVLSRQQLDAAKATADSADAAVNAAGAQVHQADAQVMQKKAALAIAQTNLDHTTIRSPIDGTVVARNIDVGQTVAASLQAPTLFNIAEDLTKMQVYAKTDESDVGQIRPGQEVTFKVDAFPKDTFKGRVEQVRMNPTTVQNVVTYDTIVDFDNPDLKLFPGMTAYVSIPVANATNVLKVPNASLRFKPADAKQTAPADTQAKSRQGGGDGSFATVWKLGEKGALTPVRVKLGITDHTYTEVAQVFQGQLNAGDKLATGSASGQSQSAGGVAPGMRPGAGMGRMGR